PQLQPLPVANSYGAKSGINTVTGVRDYLTSSICNQTGEIKPGEKTVGNALPKLRLAPTSEDSLSPIAAP
ncbi:hypothetical protein, partial [Pseudomonas sp. NPDC086278]|uniref:hypothetical protein n=1 Tax=Pseudomonas sp. NPDC086278 TaxID=3390646 RepID=UPI003D01AFF8